MIFLLDIGDKPKYLDSRPSCSSRTLTNDLIHPRITFTNYKIKGEYFDGHDWQKIDILIDTGASFQISLFS